MKVTPKRLMLVGLAVVILAALVGGTVNFTSDVSTTGDPVLWVGYSVGGLIFVVGLLAWIVELGVRSARDR